MNTYKGKVQYVRFYTAGSAAQKLETRVDQKVSRAKAPRPAAPQVRKAPLVVEPYALIGTVIAVVMVVCVAFGFFEVNRANSRKAAMETYIQTVAAENQALQKQYEQGYDPDTVRITAEAMGLVPVEQVRHIKVSIVEPLAEPEPTFWESLWEDIKELFA